MALTTPEANRENPPASPFQVIRVHDGYDLHYTSPDGSNIMWYLSADIDGVLLNPDDLYFAEVKRRQIEQNFQRPSEEAIK